MYKRQVLGLLVIAAPQNGSLRGHFRIKRFFRGKEARLIRRNVHGLVPVQGERDGGLAGAEIIVKGPSADLHSGVFGGAVANPIAALAEIIASFHDEDVYKRQPPAPAQRPLRPVL